MLTDQQIEDAVLQGVESALGVPRERVQLTDHLIRDLRMDTDLAFNDLFLPALEAVLRVRLSNYGWDGVFSVGDVVNLVQQQRDNGML
ncbi:MAG: hypothetical protein H0W30_08930 [Gemmatimonadaceae bacterium]|nr:hypothetical protein [Gemmatimonadaceae bacterium]